MTDKTPSDYFDRAKALHDMLLAVQEDIKQLRADAIEEMGLDDMPKEQAKEIRKDLAEVFAVAKIEVKGEIERRNQAAKMARRKRIAEECGVQLDLLDDTDAGAAQRMARAAAKSADDATERPKPVAPDDYDGKKDPLYERAVGVCVSENKGSTSLIQRHLQIGYNRAARMVEAMERDGILSAADHIGKRKVLIAPTGEVLDDDEEPQRAATSEEPAVMHAGGMNERDWQAMGDIPDFLRR